MSALEHRVGKRVADARMHCGLSQERAAALLGIDRPRLSGIENGKRPVDVTMLVRFAATYGVTVGYLVGAEGEEQPVQEVQLRAAAARWIDDAEASATLSGFFTFIERFTALRNEREWNSPEPDLPDWHHHGRGDTRKYAIEGDAEQLRRRWNLGDQPIGTRIFDVLEERGVWAYRQALTVERISGAYVRHDELGPVMFVNAHDWPYRQVFTAAHELAHHLYHRGAGVSYRRDSSSDEIRANEFASAFLMPESAIKGYLSRRGPQTGKLSGEDVIGLHRHFGVSYHAMLVRLRRLGILKEAQYTPLSKTRPVIEAQQLGYSVAGWEFGYCAAEQEAEERLKWLPRAYRRLVHWAWEKHRLTDRQAASYLNLDYEEWSDLATAPADEVPWDDERAEYEFLVR